MRTASFSLLTILCLLLAVAPAMADSLYSNGAYNGTTDAWTINFGFSVSDSFTMGIDQIQGLSLVYWDASSQDVLTTVDMQLGSTSFGGNINTLSGVTNTFLGTNQYGYNLYQASYSSFGSLPWSGAGFVTLSNACSTSGCSVSNPIYWDENSGPSTAYENTLGSVPSEAFTLIGGTSTFPFPTPEPVSIMLVGSSIVGLTRLLRRKRMS
jgi:hypothetical protein